MPTFWRVIIIFLKKLFIYFWLCWVFVSVRGLSLVVASGIHSSSRCMGLSLSWSLLLRSTGSRHTGSVVVAHGPSCSVARGIFPDQGSNPCPLHWQADSQPLRHQGSPRVIFFIINGYWILSKAFSACIEMIIWFLLFNLLIWCITLIDLQILKNPCIPGINPTWSWCTILFMYCWSPFASILLMIFGKTQHMEKNGALKIT